MADADWSLALAAQPIAWALSFCFSCLVVGTIPELNRWTGLLLLLAPAYGAFQTSPDFSPDDYFNDTYSRFVIILFSHMAAFCFMREGRTSIVQDKDQKTKPDDKKEATISWIGGWKRAFNSRGVGLTWENTYLWPGQKSTTVFARPSTPNAEPTKPQPSLYSLVTKGKWSAISARIGTLFASPATYKDKPIRPPPSRHNLATKGKWAAISVRLGYFLLNFTLLTLYYEFAISSTVGGFTLDDLAPDKESLLPRLLHQYLLLSSSISPASPLTKRELHIRAFLAVHKFAPDYLSLSAFHDFLAILFLLFNIDQSWEWPPLFGSPTQAYSVRRFWGTFWHRLIYKSFTFHASVVTRALRIPQGTSVSRILNNCLVFMLSAVMHALVTWRFGGRCAWGRGMLFWCVQPVAFVLEGVVQMYWGRVRRELVARGWVKDGGVLLRGGERVVGYAWVFGWFMWTAPQSAFVARNCPRVG